MFYVALCFVEAEGTLLLLLRAIHTSLGGLWGPPSGRINQGEDPLTAMRRELREETGYHIGDRDIGLLEYIRKIWVGHSRMPDSIFYLYRLVLPQKFPVVIDRSEHDDFLWVDRGTDFSGVDTVPDLEEIIKLVYSS